MIQALIDAKHAVRGTDALIEVRAYGTKDTVIHTFATAPNGEELATSVRINVAQITKLRDILTTILTDEESRQ